jgi:hypothetical protein
MAIDFPASPTVNDTFTANGVVYTWDGTKWTAVTPAGDKIVEGNTNAEVIDTGSDGRFIVTTEGTERLRIDQNGVVTAKNGAVAEIGTLTDAATITPNLATKCNFTVTLGGNRTLANPSNQTAGQSGSIFIVQDGTGSRTLAYGTDYEFAGGTAPTLSTTANAVDRIDYIVRASGNIHCVFTANYS